MAMFDLRRILLLIYVQVGWFSLFGIVVDILLVRFVQREF